MACSLSFRFAVETLTIELLGTEAPVPSSSLFARLGAGIAGWDVQARNVVTGPCFQSAFESWDEPQLSSALIEAVCNPDQRNDTDP
jgi:hypothetical protein